MTTPTDIQIYCNYMAEVRTRLGVVADVLSGRIAGGTDFLGTEIVFLQLRKTLELIAFASLAANRAAYSAVHNKFAEHWRVKAILDEIGKLNADFYPMALDAPQDIAPGRKHFPRPMDGFLTRDEFVLLYDAASAVLHTRNPYTAKDPMVQIPYTVPECISRIQRLLAWHRVQLIGGALWIVMIPDHGDVQAWAADPMP